MRATPTKSSYCESYGHNAQYPTHVSEGMEIYHKLGPMEKWEHEEMAHYIQRKAISAYNREMPSVCCCTLGTNPKVISALCWDVWPVKEVALTTNHRILKVTVVVPVKKPKYASSSCCSIL